VRGMNLHHSWNILILIFKITFAWQNGSPQLKLNIVESVVITLQTGKSQEMILITTNASSLLLKQRHHSMESASKPQPST